MLSLPEHVGDVTLGTGGFTPASLGRQRLFPAWEWLKDCEAVSEIAKAHVTAPWKNECVRTGFLAYNLRALRGH